jgi:hypothetical protein
MTSRPAASTALSFRFRVVKSIQLVGDIFKIERKLMYFFEPVNIGMLVVYEYSTHFSLLYEHIVPFLLPLH